MLFIVYFHVKREVTFFCLQENSKKRKAATQVESDPKRKKEEEEERKRVEKLWKIKDSLKAKYNANEMKAILKYNDQSTSGGPSDLLERLADCEMFALGMILFACTFSHGLFTGMALCHAAQNAKAIYIMSMVSV